MAHKFKSLTIKSFHSQGRIYALFGLALAFSNKQVCYLLCAAKFKIPVTISVIIYIFVRMSLSTFRNMAVYEQFTIDFYRFSDKVVTENWNVPYVYGKIDLTTLKPHRKNPLIANVFSQMGIVEELGSGTRKIFKYTPLISGGKEPMIEEEDVYKVTIPMEAGVQNEKLEWTKLWNQLGLSKGLSKGLSNEQIGLFFESLMKPVAASKLRVILGYTNATKFKNSYIVPLMEQGLVVMSQPDKPNSPTQKYYLTEKGKRVIGSVGEEQ